MGALRSRFEIIRLRILRLWRTLLLVTVAATAAAVVCERMDWLNVGSSEVGAYDQGLTFFTYGGLRQALFPSPPPKSKDVVIVAIDDRTFEAVRANPSYALTFGTWPYSRNLWARVLEHLSSEGARAVAFDMVMDERHTDASGDLAIADAAKQTGVPFFLGFSVSASSEEAMKARRLPKVTPQNRFASKPAPPPAAPEGSAPGAETFPEEESFPEESPGDAKAAPKEDDGYPKVSAEEVATALAFPVRTSGGLTLSPLTEENGALQLPNRPIAPLVPVVSGFGLVKHEADDDGKIRRTRFAYTDGDNTYVTLSTAVVADLFGAKEVELSPGRLKIGDRSYDINPDGTAELSFGGVLEDRFPQVSLIAVLDDWLLAKQGKERRLPKGYFRDKVVLVAGYAAGTYDVKATPFSASTPGVVKIAAELDNFLGNGFIVSAPYWVSLLLTFFVALLSAAIILAVKSTWVEIGWPLLLFFGFFTVTGFLLVTTHVHVLSAMPGMAGSFASVVAVTVNHLFASKDREYLRQAFSRYMEKDLLDQMVESRELPKLTGENLEVTAFFSDIRGFSTFSETFKDDPKTLVKVMNTYLTRVTAVLVKHGACIDKYIGDAVVCLFGAPIRYPDHAVRACRAALEVDRELTLLREEFRQQGLPDVFTRIGLNSAVMLVGNIGSDQLLDYTAIGDGMNLAARLEGANKAYETTIMLGEGTYQLAREHLEVRELDLVRVAGKKQAARVFELLALKGEATADQLAVRKEYGRALVLYRQEDFQEAIGVLEASLARYPADGPSKALLARCRKLHDHPPATFDGIVDLEK